MTSKSVPALPERHLHEWALFILAIGVILRVQGLDWDMGQLFNPDEFNLASGAAALAWPHGLVPRFHAYNGLALYLPRLLAEALSPFTGRPGTDLGHIVLAGRMLSALWSCLTLWVLWRAASDAFGAAIGVFVLTIAAATPALIQSAHFATTESGLMLCLVILVWLAMRHLAERLSLLPFALLSGLALGLGFGLKSSVLAMAIIPVMAIGLTVLRHGQVLRSGAALAGIMGLVALLAMVTTPQIWAAWPDYVSTMQFESSVVSGAADVFWTYQFVGKTPVLFELGQLFWLMGPVLTAIAFAGLCIVLAGVVRRDVTAQALLPAACFALAYGVIIFSWHAKFVRYLAIMCPVLLLFAGYFVSRIVDRRQRLALMVGVATITAIAGLLQAAIYQAPDPRIAAWEWLAPQIGDKQIIIEPNEVGPGYWAARSSKPLAVVPVLDPSSPAKVAAMADVLQRGDFMLIASRRHHGVLPGLRERFPEMCGYYQALWAGELGYNVIARFQRRPDMTALFPPELWAEETFTVFDSPQVLVLRKDRALSSADLALAVERNMAACRLP